MIWVPSILPWHCFPKLFLNREVGWPDWRDLFLKTVKCGQDVKFCYDINTRQIHLVVSLIGPNFTLVSTLPPPLPPLNDRGIVLSFRIYFYTNSSRLLYKIVFTVNVCKQVYIRICLNQHAYGYFADEKE